MKPFDPNKVMSGVSAVEVSLNVTATANDMKDPRGPILVKTRPQRGWGPTDPKIVARINVLCRHRASFFTRAPPVAF